ncbi:MAG: T9SS type A sorting domain-containing protein [Chlorobi bacterium]|nr:T9SS type A sorting domain-containing protein [Chlorobiota bacterium]
MIFLIFLNMRVPEYSQSFASPVADTITPPPGSPDTLSGPAESCVGDTAVYSAELPVGCSADWYIDTVLQSSDSAILEVVWTDEGNYTVSLYFNCDSGTFFSDSLQVTVNGTPAMPGVINGDPGVCKNTNHSYSTTIDTGEWCEWWVAGEMQSATDTIMVYTFGDPGDYLIEVFAMNDCGNSSQASTLMVTAFDNPVVNLGNDTTIYEGQSLTLDAGNSGSQYIWSTGDTTRTITVSETGSYSVLVTNACGEDSDTIFVDVIVDVLNIKVKNNIIVYTRGHWLIIKSPGTEIQQMIISDVSGKIVYKGAGRERILLPGKGIYVVKLKSGNTIFIRKIPVI